MVKNSGMVELLEDHEDKGEAPLEACAVCGSFAFFAGSTGNLTIFCIAGGKMHRCQQIPSRSAVIKSLAGVAGREVVSGHADGTIRLWRVK